MNEPDGPNPKADESTVICDLCNSLPDDLTVNTGREEYFPGAVSLLIGMDSEYKSEFRCCPSCRTYFNWIDMPQMYGSGNNDVERLVRLSPQKSRLLDKLFSSDSNYLPGPIEVEEFINTLSHYLLIQALRFHLHRAPKVVAPFVPPLVGLLAKNNDTSLWDFLRSYVSSYSERAKEILVIAPAYDENTITRLTQLLDQCRKVVNRE